MVDQQASAGTGQGQVPPVSARSPAGRARRAWRSAPLCRRAASTPMCTGTGCMARSGRCRRSRSPSMAPLPSPQASDVRCVTAKRCVMSGYAAPDANGQTLYTPEAWVYNGRSWRLISLPKSYRSAGGALSDVACASAKTCWLVRYEYHHSSATAPERAVAFRWNGHSLMAAGAIAEPATGSIGFDRPELRRQARATRSGTAARSTCRRRRSRTAPADLPRQSEAMRPSRAYSSTTASVSISTRHLGSSKRRRP